MSNGNNEPTLVGLIMDELRKQGQDLREHSDKAEKSSQEIKGELSAVREQQQGFAIEIRSIHGQLKEIKRQVEPIVSQVAVNADNIGELKKDKADLYDHITGLKDAVRSSDQSKVLPPASFWDGPNAAAALKIIGYLLLGLLGLAGLNMAMVKDLI